MKLRICTTFYLLLYISSCTSPSRCHLRSTNDDVVDWNEYQLDEKSNKSHHNKTDRRTGCNLGKFFAIRLVAPFDEPNAVFGEISKRIENSIESVHFGSENKIRVFSSGSRSELG
uniref:Putative ovule protein n=1 Tax=Solanum chacoense TaxID=4108 RepID=A0A0V0HD25_SOLCH